MYNTVPLEQLKLNQVAGRFGYPLGAACYCGTKKVIDWLLERGASTGTADATQRYPLHFAAYRDKFIFQQLCDHGADLGVRDHMGRTVLHVAVQSSSPDLVKYIVSKAKYLRKARDKDNWTPLHYALRGCSRGWNSTVPDKQQEIVELLLSEDACDDSDFKIYNHEKETWSLLKFARYHGANRRTCDTLEAILEKRAGEQWPSQRSEHRTKLANRHGPVSCDYCFMVGSRLPRLKLRLLLTGPSSVCKRIPLQV
jgi:ankyrin repeat protein